MLLVFRRTVVGMKAKESRRQRSRHQAVSQQPVMSPQPRGELCQRRLGVSRREAALQQAVGGPYWITEYPSRTVVKAIVTNGEAG